MHQASHLLPVVAIFFAGCASAPTAKPTADYPKEQAQIRRRLDEIIDAAEKKDFNRLDSYLLYGQKFTKFAPEAPGRLDADAARKGEHEGLAAAADIRMQADDLKIDVFGHVGIATFVLKYSFKTPTGTIEKETRSTMVFVKEGGAWKIAHEHLSAFKPN
jgi:ketosteroid isomerase-like protein